MSAAQYATARCVRSTDRSWPAEETYGENEMILILLWLLGAPLLLIVLLFLLGIGH